MLEDLSKSNIYTLLGLAALSVVLPRLVPQLRPTLTSAIKAGVTLLAESEVEAEAELVSSLVATTMQAIEDALAQPVSDGEARDAVRKQVRHFKRQARVRARRWAADDHDGHRRYRRHVAKLESALAERKRRARRPRTHQIIEDAFISLAQEAPAG
jgi:uncharacterized membrane protein